MKLSALIFALALIASPLSADMAQRPGWAVHPTEKSHAALVDAVKAAAKANGMGVVTEAGPTGAARARGIEIPENRVIGLFNNVFAVRILGLSEAAMIEAPVRMYVTENSGCGATLSYKTPSHVFAPYLDEGGSELGAAAAELDTIFADIAKAALQ